MSYGYNSPNGRRYYRREDYEESLQPPVYGPRFLAPYYGAVSRFCTFGAAQKIDGWLRRIDEKGEALQEISANSHKNMPAGVLLSGVARGLRYMQRKRVKPWAAMAAGTAMVMGLTSLLGGGLVIGAFAAMAALPVSTGVGALGLLCVLGVPRAALEGLRALVNIPIGYKGRRQFFEMEKEKEERAAKDEKSALGPLCQAVFDDEKLAEKSSPAERSDWIYGLAKHFPEEFLEAARKIEKRDPAPLRLVKNLKNLPN